MSRTARGWSRPIRPRAVPELFPMVRSFSFDENPAPTWRKDRRGGVVRLTCGDYAGDQPALHVFVVPSSARVAVGAWIRESVAPEAAAWWREVSRSEVSLAMRSICLWEYDANTGDSWTSGRWGYGD